MLFKWNGIVRFIFIPIIWLLSFHSKISIHSLHITGSFNTNDFFKFITRFGIQPTDMHNDVSTRGYIYGNITISPDDPSTTQMLNDDKQHNALIMLTVMDYTNFIDYYNKRVILPRSVACSLMFEKIDKVAYFYECNEEGQQDFIRRVPCPVGKVCVDEEARPINVISGNQFTFKIQDLNQPRFWYISLVACVRENCQWSYLGDNFQTSHFSTTSPSHNNITSSSSSISNITTINTTTTTTTTTTTKTPFELKMSSYTVHYDIWLVNGAPAKTISNRFEHHFTYELHDVFEIYLYSFFVYLFIIPFIFYRLYSHFHYLYLQLLIYVGIELLSRSMSLIHYLIFSYDGQGVYVLQLLSELTESIGGSVFIFILIAVAKGWTIRSRSLKLTRRSYLLGFLLQAILVISHMIALVTVDPVFNTNNYRTVAGYVEVGIRLMFMFWFIVELKETSSNLETAAIRNTQTEKTNGPRNINDVNESSDEIEFDDDDYEVENNGKKYQKLNSKSKKLIYENFSTEERLKNYQKFYLHYGACSLVWFINLPVIIFVTSFVSELSRSRLVLIVVLFYIMWSPKTPLKLPGKKPPVKYDINNLQYLISQGFSENNEDDDNDEDLIYSKQLTASTSL